MMSLQQIQAMSDTMTRKAKRARTVPKIIDEENPEVSARFS